MCSAGSLGFARRFQLLTRELPHRFQHPESWFRVVVVGSPRQHQTLLGE
jgi:hypothetical protein